MNKNKLVALTLVLVLITCACMPTLGLAEERQKLTVWSNFGSEVDVFGDYLKAFGEKHPEIDYDLTFYGEEYRTQIRMAISSGVAPDILFTYAGENFKEFVAADACLDITDIVAENKFADRVDPAYFDNFTVDGRILGMPIGGVTVWQCLYANKDLLDQNGLEVPKTVDELIACSKALKEKGIATLALGDVDGWPGVLLLGDYFYQKAPFSDAEALIRGDAKFVDSQPMRDALETLAQFGREGVFMDGFGTQGIADSVQAWAAGKSAFMYCGSWWTGITDGSTDFGFTIEPIWLPRMNGVNQPVAIQMSCDNVMMIFKNSTSVEAAVKFMDYFTTEEAQKIYCESNNIFSIYPGLNEQLTFDPIFKQAPIQDQFSMPKTGVFFDNAFPIAIREKMKTCIVDVVAGKMSVDDALAAWDVEMTKK